MYFRHGLKNGIGGYHFHLKRDRQTLEVGIHSNLMQHPFLHFQVSYDVIVRLALSCDLGNDDEDAQWAVASKCL